MQMILPGKKGEIYVRQILSRHCEIGVTKTGEALYRSDQKCLGREARQALRHIAGYHLTLCYHEQTGYTIP